MIKIPRLIFLILIQIIVTVIMNTELMLKF